MHIQRIERPFDAMLRVLEVGGAVRVQLGAGLLERAADPALKLAKIGRKNIIQ